MCGVFLFFIYRQHSSVVQIYLNQSVVSHSMPVMLIATTQEQLRTRSIKQAAENGHAAQTQKINSVQKNMTSIATIAKAPLAKEEKKTKAVPKKEENKIVTDQPKKDDAKKNLEKKEKEQKSMQPPKKKATETKSQSIEKKLVAQNSEEKLIPSVQESVQKNDVVYATVREVELYRQQQLLTQEIVQHWKPPAGIAADCACQVSFTVDWNGQLADIGITQSSGVLIFDLAARSALCAMKMPEWAKGKTFTVVLHNTGKGAV